MIEIVSPYYDSTGYGAASRHTIKAIMTQTDKIILHPFSFESDLKKDKVNNKMFKKFESKNHGDFVIYQSPAEYVQHSMKTPFAIYTEWEVDGLPDNWVTALNKADKVIAPSKFVKNVFVRHGVTTPVVVVPHPVDVKLLQTPVNDNKLSELFSDDVYAFYTIGEFNERKNIVGLIRAFLYAFGGREDVRLIIKTFFSDHGRSNSSGILEDISRYVKESKIGTEKGQIAIITDKLTDEQIAFMHQNGDCYVSFHRGEGYGFPVIEAAVAGANVIATGFGGVTEFDGFYREVLFGMEPVHSMPWIPWFNGRMMWATPNLDHGIALMRATFREGKKRNTFSGVAAQKFSYEAIGRKFKEEMPELFE